MNIQLALLCPAVVLFLLRGDAAASSSSPPALSTPAENAADSGSADPLGLWLSTIEIDLPNITLGGQGKLYTVQLYAVTCGGLAVRTVSATSSKPPGIYDGGLAVAVAGLSADCTAQWSAALMGAGAGAGAGEGAGDVDAAISQGSVGVSIDQSGLTASFGVLGKAVLEVEKCDTTLNIQSVKWQGVASKLLDWLSKEAETPLQDALQAIGCLGLRTAGKQLLTTLLQDFDKQVAPYLQPPDLLTTSTPAVDPEAEGDLFSAAVEARGDDSGGGDSAVAGMVDWRVSGWLALADYVLNSYFTIPQINAMTAPGHGAAVLASSCLLAAQLPVTFENITLSVALKEVQFTGLDTIEIWKWLLPSTAAGGGPSALLSHAGIANMSARLVLDTTVSIKNSSTLRVPHILALPLTVNLTLAHAALKLGLDLEVMEEAVDLLNLAQDTEIGCLIRTVASAAASELRVSYQDAALAVDDGAGSDGASLLPQIKNAGHGVLQLLGHVHHTTVSAVLAALLAGPGRLAVNGQISAALAKLKGTLPEQPGQGLSGLLSLSCDAFPEPLAPQTAPPMPPLVVYLAMPGTALFALLCVVFACLCGSKKAEQKARVAEENHARRNRWNSTGLINSGGSYNNGPFMEQRKQRDAVVALSQARSTLTQMVASPAGHTVTQPGGELSSLVSASDSDTPMLPSPLSPADLTGGSYYSRVLRMQRESPPPSPPTPRSPRLPPPSRLSPSSIVSGKPAAASRMTAASPPLGHNRPWWMHLLFGVCLAAAAALRVWTIAAPLARIGLSLSVDKVPNTASDSEDLFASVGGAEMAEAVSVSVSLIDGTLQRFSCTQMVRDFWQAGATVLTGLILCGSVLFPFTKQLIMLYAWVVPWPAKLPLSRRLWLHSLHILGRSAFAAEFFLGYIVCLFYIKVDSGPFVTGEPLAPIYGGLLSTALCSVLSHGLLLAAEPETPPVLSTEALLRDSLVAAGVSSAGVRLTRGDSAGSITSGLLSDPRQAGGLAERGRAESAASDFSQIILGEGGAADDDWLRQGTLQATSSNEAGQGAARSNRRRVVIAGMVFWLASLGTYAYVLTGPIVSFTTSGLVGDATIFFKQNDVGQDVQSYGIIDLPLEFQRKTDVGGGKYIISAVILVVAMVGPVAFMLASLVALIRVATEKQGAGPGPVGAAVLADHLYGWVGTEVLWLSALASAREMNLVAQWVFGQHFLQTCANLESTLGISCVEITGEVEVRCWLLLVSAVMMGGLRLALEGLLV